MDNFKKELIGLPKDELVDFIAAYSDYVQQIVSENEGEPVCAAEFYEYDYQEYVKGE